MQNPSNSDMKALPSLSLVGLAVIIAATSVGYSAHMRSRMRDLERRLQHAEALLQSHSQSLASSASAERIRGLKQRVARAELAEAQEVLAARSGTAGLE